MDPHIIAKTVEKKIAGKTNDELLVSTEHGHTKGIEIRIDPVNIARLLAIATILILIASLCANYLTGIDLIRRFGRLLNVDEEKNIPTAFSVFLLQFAATLLAMIASLKWKKSFWKAFNWIILSAGFFFMAVDEGWGIHEMFGNKTIAYHGMLLFSWVLVFIPLVLFLFLFFLQFLFDLPRRTRYLFLLSGILYLGGAIFMESVSAPFYENNGIHSFSYILVSTTEEGLEMSGVILFIYSLLDYINYHYHQVRLTFKQPRITLKRSVSKKN